MERAAVLILEVGDATLPAAVHPQKARRERGQAPDHRLDQRCRRIERLLHQSGLAAAFITCAMSGCSLDVKPAIGPARMERSPFSRMTAGARWMPPVDSSLGDCSLAPSNAMPTPSMSRVISADDDAGVAPGSATQTQPTATNDAAAGSSADSGPSTDAGAVTIAHIPRVEARLGARRQGL